MYRCGETAVCRTVNTVLYVGQCTGVRKLLYVEKCTVLYVGQYTGVGKLLYIGQCVQVWGNDCVCDNVYRCVETVVCMSVCTSVGKQSYA